jgi:hypothetical protein
MPFFQRHVSRRKILTTTVAGVGGLAPVASALAAVSAVAGNESTEINSSALIHALRSIGKPVCMEVADELAASIRTSAGFDLHLRSAGLTQADARMLANGMIQSNADNGPVLWSFSASYNPELGDAGASSLAGAFPNTMTELGLVACSIGDAGGRALLDWAKSAPELRMICIEGNRFSAVLQSQFHDLARRERHVLVVV